MLVVIGAYRQVSLETAQQKDLKRPSYLGAEQYGSDQLLLHSSILPGRGKHYGRASRQTTSSYVSPRCLGFGAMSGFCLFVCLLLGVFFKIDPLKYSFMLAEEIGM